MKKKLLILTMCLFSALSANAASWVAIDSGNPDIQLFIDTDSIKYTKVDTCTYALLYKKGDEQPLVIYAVSDYSTDKAGIVRREDFNIEKYNPGYYRKHALAFMKDTKGNILSSAHNYALAMYNEKAGSNFNTDISITNIKNVNTYLPNEDKLGLSDEEYSAYVAKIKSDILNNWQTSINSVYTNVNLIISINPDGSYNGYRLLQSNADEKAKRAAIAAVNLSAPFASFPEGASYSRTVNIPVVFEQKLLKKYVK